MLMCTRKAFTGKGWEALQVRQEINQVVERTSVSGVEAANTCTKAIEIFKLTLLLC